jgi:hypothetical protein
MGTCINLLLRNNQIGLDRVTGFESQERFPEVEIIKEISVAPTPDIILPEAAVISDEQEQQVLAANTLSRRKK